MCWCMPCIWKMSAKYARVAKSSSPPKNFCNDVGVAKIILRLQFLHNCVLECKNWMSWMSAEKLPDGESIVRRITEKGSANLKLESIIFNLFPVLYLVLIRLIWIYWSWPKRNIVYTDFEPFDLIFKSINTVTSHKKDYFDNSRFSHTLITCTITKFFFGFCILVNNYFNSVLLRKV